MKTLFWNVDTQYDFMRKDGALYVPGAEEIEGNLEKLTNHAAKHKIKVINTADWHNEKTAEIAFAPAKPDFVMTFPPHCMQGTDGAGYIPATRPEQPLIVEHDVRLFYNPMFNFDGYQGSFGPTEDKVDPYEIDSYRNIVIHKDKFDVFEGNKHTNQILDHIKPNQIVVYGVATNYCVNWAVQGLVNRGFEVYVVKDAIKELPLPKENDWNHEDVMRKWEDSGVKLITTEKVLDNYR